ncbi:MAG: hypothetical protein PHH17_01315 [Candidatus Pacebacteria bacterium]|nr:hypothetical protein [Candidatus Paceibacterota bacterium]MDD3728963.1 hypothetical protein [Candidatus Paceibacterota bacterium]MDD4201636.1 hypothetical protein [Candidatus Paceibacterota bacterium]MDD4466966.1 hypothetical protein [Candidatus Paceibacterota bacterium]MDD4897726.1 hypothetical protein [Candidatus Paceibacterota bacterium]
MREVDIFKDLVERSSFDSSLQGIEESSWEVCGGFFPQFYFEEEFVLSSQREES